MTAVQPAMAFIPSGSLSVARRVDFDEKEFTAPYSRLERAISLFAAVISAVFTLILFFIPASIATVAVASSSGQDNISTYIKNQDVPHIGAVSAGD